MSEHVGPPASSVPPAVLAGVGGRPSLYSEALTDEICGELSESSVSLNTICKRDGMPKYRTVMQWLERYPEFAQKCARARDLQADVLAEQTLEIADDTSGDTTVNADGDTVVDHDHISRSRLRVDTRKWIAGKLKPKKYGDKLLHTGADGEGPVQFAVTLNYAALDEDELMTLRRLLAKCSVQQSQARLIEGQATEVASDE